MKRKLKFSFLWLGAAWEPSAAIERGAFSLLFWFVGYGPSGPRQQAKGEDEQTPLNNSLNK